MGNAASSDQKLSHYLSSCGKKPRGIIWFDEQFGYKPPADRSETKDSHERKASYYVANTSRITRQRSHSLDAILGDLYGSDKKDKISYRRLSSLNHLKFSTSLIPRIKQTRDMPIKEDSQYSSDWDIYSCPQNIERKDTRNASQNEKFIATNRKMDDNSKRTFRTRSFDENDLDCDISNKAGENYFTKNFDGCIKRLEIIEKEQKTMGSEEKNLSAYNLKKQLKRQMIPFRDGSSPPPVENALLAEEENKVDEGSQTHFSLDSERTMEEIKMEEPIGVLSVSISADEETLPVQKFGMADSPSNNFSQSDRGWYSNVKQRFENEREKSCRIMGAMLKSPNVETQMAENEGKEVRHYFSRLVKSNKRLIDEELPDPDKVQNIRAMFQESLNSNLQKNINKFGGSLQNINKRPQEDECARPKSAQGDRNDFATEFRPGIIEKNSSNGQRECQDTTKRELPKGNSRYNDAEDEMKKVTDPVLHNANKTLNKKIIRMKWTDTTSLSSGVSSDLSSYDTDAESCSRTETEINTTDEGIQEEISDKHYVQNEALEKIRSFGTSVTYFGGQMITCSIGPLVSPTTQAILAEIGDKNPVRKNFAKVFEEFYRKYNEPKRKKLGRTRSFGQNDLFYKLNVLNDTEIEMYKNDLEMEIGIRKPSGRNQNILNQKSVESNGVDRRLNFFQQEVIDKLNEILETAVEMVRTEKQNGDNAKDVSETYNENNDPAEEIAEVSKCERMDTQKNVESECETSSEQSCSLIQSNDLIFGHEKSLYDNKEKTGMEYEEFEISGATANNAEKLEENSENYRLTIQINHKKTEEKSTIEEIIIDEQEPLDSLEIYLKPSKQEKAPSDSLLETRNVAGPKNFFQNETLNEIHSNNFVVKELNSNEENDFTENTKNGSIVKYYKNSKWPIETSVMIDIQKNELRTPQLVTMEKSFIKNKTRSFKK